MNVDLYHAGLRELEAENQANLIALADWSEKDALPWLWAEIGGMSSRKKVGLLKPCDAIRQGLQVTYTDRQTMPLELSFYVAQMTMLDAEIKRYCLAIRNFNSAAEPRYADATIHTLHRALKSHLQRGLVLLEQAGHALLELPTIYGAWTRRKEHPFEIFKGAEQSIYGTYSWLTHTDRAPFVPVAVLRTAIEMRIRGAFGIQGYIDSTNANLVPIDMSRIFEVIKLRLPSMNFAVDFNDVVRVYRWSNAYLHGGWRDFEWVAGFCLQYLRPLFADPRDTPEGGWSIDGGIRMYRSDWREVRNHFVRIGRGENKSAFQRAWAHLRVQLTGHKPRTLDLNDADEQSALCVFLD